MGQVKTNYGIAKTRFRGITKVEMQFIFAAAAINPKKLLKMLDIEREKSRLSLKISNIIQMGKIFSKACYQVND